MYIPKHFQVTDRDEIVQFIHSNAFGQLISDCDGRPFSTHLPFMLSDDQTYLSAHLARQNPQLASIDGQDVLVTLQGPHDYISPTWYDDPGVPTWNYQAVHIYGTCHTQTDPDLLGELVNELAGIYESKQPAPWTPEYKAAMLRAIVGIRIDIKEIQAKFKLSQNRSDKDRQQVIDHLTEYGSNDLANAMSAALTKDRE